jgi:hypothetical protein
MVLCNWEKWGQALIEDFDRLHRGQIRKYAVFKPRSSIIAPSEDGIRFNGIPMNSSGEGGMIHSGFCCIAQ